MKALGSHGETLTADYLQAEGYVILARNWRCERGEIDIVANDRKTLVFIEVKTRRTDHCGDGFAAVDTRKQEKLRLLARHFIHQTGTTAHAYRFDVVAVDGNDGNITHLKNAF
ncbi:MAG: YraN family protein [Bacillota bacterium]|nr:YraN family protein [Bacillota bacterium]MDW7684435.1 YraN family protein [Bacillota bacterium]